MFRRFTDLLRRGAALAVPTALETCRQPVFLLAELAMSLAILLFPLVLNYTLGDTARVVRDSALSLAFAGGLVLAVHSAVSAVSRDLRRGPAATWLAADLPRPVWFAGKCAGVALAALLCTAATLPATLLAVRACGAGLHTDWPVAAAALLALPLSLALAAAWNLATRRPAAATAAVLLPAALVLAWVFATLRGNPDLPPAATLDLPIAAAALLLLLPVLMAVPLGAAAAVAVPPGAAMALSLAVFGAGLFPEAVLAPRLAASTLARAAFALVPDLQAYWLPDALDAAGTVPLSYLAHAAATAACWSAAVSVLGALALHRREIAA